MSWVPQYALLIAFSTLCTWATGYYLDREENKTRRKFMLALNIFVNLGILFTFKYYNYFSFLYERVFRIQYETLPRLNVLLPVGISFYTFQALGYSIDVYRGPEKGGIRHERSLLNYAVFVAFFPQLVAGPIERSANLLPQFREKHFFSAADATVGLRLILFGLFKKVVIADMSALYVDAVYDNPTDYAGLPVLLAVILFSIQIYCDFSGYSDVARGTALLFGFRLMENFKAPYLSLSIKEFWSRWHISLSTWFRDYLYIPLGGGRCKPLRKIINLLVVFLLSGIWHGAGMSFVAWGLLHGTMRIAEIVFVGNVTATKKNKGNRIKEWLQMIMVFIFVSIAWIFFRAQSLRQALLIIKKIIDIAPGWISVEIIRITVTQIMPDIAWIRTGYFIIIAVSIVVLFVVDYLYRFKEKRIEYSLGEFCVAYRWFFYYAMIIIIMFSFVMTTNEYGQAGAFIYFQF